MTEHPIDTYYRLAHDPEYEARLQGWAEGRHSQAGRIAHLEHTADRLWARAHAPETAAMVEAAHQAHCQGVIDAWARS